MVYRKKKRLEKKALITAYRENKGINKKSAHEYISTEKKGLDKKTLINMYIDKKNAN